MDRAAQGDLALDVDQFAASQPHLRGDACRMAERHAAESIDGKAINLPDPLAIRLDANGLSPDLLLEAPIEAVRAPATCRRRRVNVRRANHATVAGVGQMIGLLHQVAKRRDLRRYLVAVAADPHRFLDHPRHRATLEWSQIVALRSRRDQT